MRASLSPEVAMKTLGFACGLIVLSASLLVAAEPFVLPKADGEKWVRRIQAFARDGWKATLRGNEIVLAREQPVRFVRVLPNAPPQDPNAPQVEPPLERGTYRLTLRFAPRMSLDEYERLAAINAASEKEQDRLHRAVKLPNKFDDFIATTEEEKKRLADYRAAVAKLPRHDLPDFYTDDYSLRLFTPGDGWQVVYDEPVLAECNEMEETLARAFGVYSPLAASNRSTIGRPEKAQ
jgi:hypothetical protein